MKKVFWESFYETGKIDMYMLYKEFGQEEFGQDEDIDIPVGKENPKESLESVPWEEPLI
ncbi:YqzL family protein [Irregularibacter muris]|jgi:hypothetical protein|uniref:YqzL family protein n=1 Tax=Irregularibacter muris TaxID=1796619 RepID=A0AAE3HCS7_9FIRM|nr:YqzL family protein [Irregularibacter muris]MCR1897865.1 YqzL family protein [Irregularibacter muris]